MIFVLAASGLQPVKAGIQADAFLTIEKNTIGGDGTFEFTVTPVSGASDSSDITLSITTSNGTGTDSTFLTPGIYEIKETDNPDFDLTSISCPSFTDPEVDLDNNQVNLFITEPVTCTFTNVSILSSIEVFKSTTGGDDTFDFDAGSLGAFSITTNGGSGPSESFSDLQADTYTITELDNPAFELTAIDCEASDASVNLAARSVTLNLGQGEAAQCFFRNTATFGDITIVKTSDVDSTFSFTGDLDNFNLTTSNGSASLSFSNLSTGTYSITESLNPDFDLNNLSCTGDTDGGSVINIATRTVDIDLDDGENIVCTFDNTQLTGSISVIKSSDVDGTFNFTGTDPIGSFSLTTSNGTASTSFSGLTGGSYTITEAENTAFTLDNIDCGSAQVSTDLANRSVSITLGAGENISCTFVNSAATGSITIIKSIDTGDGEFRFIGDLGIFTIQTNNQSGSATFADLDAGTFVVTELENSDYTLVDISCSGDLDNGSSISLSAREVSIDLDPNETITCTFVNEDNLDEEKIRDYSMRATRGFVFRRARNILTNEPDRTSFRRRNPEALWEDGETTSANTKPVRYAFNATAGSTQMDFAITSERAESATFERGPQLWVEGSYTKADDGVEGFGRNLDVDSEYSLLHLGADIHVRENLIVGALVTLDRANEHVDFMDDETQAMVHQEVDGTGWMAGPYMSARLAKNVFLDARVAFGASRNNLTIDNLVVDDKFETDRVLGRIALSGNKVFDENWRFTPTMAVSYYEEDINRYISNTGVPIPSQTLEYGRAEFEPELAYRHKYADGTTIEPQASLGVVWDFETPEDLGLADIPIPTQEVRGRMEGGVQVNWANGNSVRFAASYDGIGADNYDAYTLDAWLDVPLGRPMPRAQRPAEPYTPPVQYRECPDGTRVEMSEDCPVALIDMPPPEPVEFVIYFDFDKSNILPAEMAKIDRAVELAADRNIEVVILEGNTDRAGSNTYNDALSVRRAVSVQRALEARGIPTELITYDAYGENNPAVPTDDGVPLRANRRTEVRIRFR